MTSQQVSELAHLVQFVFAIQVKKFCIFSIKLFFRHSLTNCNSSTLHMTIFYRNSVKLYSCNIIALILILKNFHNRPEKKLRESSLL